MGGCMVHKKNRGIIFHNFYLIYCSDAAYVCIRPPKDVQSNHRRDVAR
jgi:hypothetical protein